MAFELLQNQTLRFVIVGSSAALLLMALSWIFVAAGMPPFPGSALAYLIAFAFAYTLQRNWTFGARHSHRQAFGRYLTAQLASAVFSGLVAHATLRWLGLPVGAMSVATAVLGSAASYVLSTRWVFSDRNADR
jgi:putative flippase GtrA